MVMKGGVTEGWFESINQGDESTLPASPLEGPPAKKTKGEGPKGLYNSLVLEKLIMSFRIPTLRLE